MAAVLHVLVRLVHVVGMAVLLGGAGFVWYHLLEHDRPAVSLLVRFEALFWATMGAMVVTGIGNLGSLGPPGPGTRWGSILTVKLAVALAFVLGSVVRTLAVGRLRERVDRSNVTPTIRRTYAATAWTLLAIVALAEVLAHG